MLLFVLLGTFAGFGVGKPGCGRCGDRCGGNNFCAPDLRTGGALRCIPNNAPYMGQCADYNKAIESDVLEENRVTAHAPNQGKSHIPQPHSIILQQTFESCENLCGEARNQPDDDNAVAENADSRRRLSTVLPPDQQCSSFDFCNACSNGQCTLLFGQPADDDDEPVGPTPPPGPPGPMKVFVGLSFEVCTMPCFFLVLS